MNNNKFFENFLKDLIDGFPKNPSKDQQEMLNNLKFIQKTKLTFDELVKIAYTMEFLKKTTLKFGKEMLEEVVNGKMSSK